MKLLHFHTKKAAERSFFLHLTLLLTFIKTKGLSHQRRHQAGYTFPQLNNKMVLARLGEIKG